MPSPSNQTHTLEVLIELGSELTRFIPPDGPEADDLETYLHSYLFDLLSDFDLPLTAHLQIKSASGGVSLPGRDTRITVNGHPVWTGPNQEIGDSVVGGGLAQWITGLLIAEPASLVNSELAGNIAADWANEGVPWFQENMTREHFAQLLHRLMARGFRITRAREWGRDVSTGPQFSSDPADIFEAVIEPLGTCSLTVMLPDELYDFAQANWENKALEPGAEDESLSGRFQLLRDGLFYELGVYLPKITIDRELILTGSLYRPRINDRRLLPVPVMDKGSVLVNARAGVIQGLGIAAVDAVNPANGNAAAMIADEKTLVDKVKHQGYWVWDRLGHLVLSFAAEVRKRNGDVYTRGVAKTQLDVLAQAYPGLVNAARARLGDDKLTRVFRGLVDDEVSIRDHRLLLEALLSIRKTVEIHPQDSNGLLDSTDVCGVTSAKTVDDLTIDELVSHCRRSLQRYLSHKYAASGTLNVYKVHSDLERRLRSLDDKPLTEADYNALINGIVDVLNRFPSKDANPAILSHFDVRSAMRNLIKSYYPHFAVLAHHELVQDVKINVMGEISLV